MEYTQHTKKDTGCRGIIFMKELNLNLSSPWEIFYKKMEAFFDCDPEITLNINRDTNIVMLYVRNTDKAEALTQLLPEKKEFGNITVEIRVVPANDIRDTASLYETAFKDNPVFAYASDGDGTSIGEGHTFVVFAREVVQYFNDSLDDINRIESTLYQEIAKDIFEEDPNVKYCTDYSYRAVAPRDKRWTPRFNYNKERNI